MAFSQHPVKAMDREFQSAYLNGLALVMDADERIRAGEQENIKRLLISFDMPEEKLEDLIDFGKYADSDALRDIVTILQGSEGLRFVFLLDCLSLAHADNELHEDETQTIKTFSESIKVSPAQLKLIEHLEEIVRTKDHKALYRFFLQKYDLDLTVFKYLLDFYKVDIEQVKQEERKRLAKLLGIEFRTVENIPNTYTRGQFIYAYTFAHGLISGDNAGYALISHQPLQLAQLVAFLQDQFEQQSIRVENTWVVENGSAKKILYLENSLLAYSHGQFSFKANNHATGLTRYGFQLVSEWIHTLTDLNLEPISMLTGFREGDQIVSGRFAFEPIEYIEVHNDSQSVGMKPYNDDGQTFEVKTIKKWTEDHTDATTVFRFMQIPENSVKLNETSMKATLETLVTRLRTMTEETEEPMGVAVEEIAEPVEATEEVAAEPMEAEVSVEEAIAELGYPPPKRNNP